ncbi:MAG TPA: proton-conducting transporter membrane subunit [Candidatus Thermoplasmatota archaeon]|nr:proton-conducting transporter membrane subunit [Candidatus Thermoplasmatota archaeon]
MLDGLFLPLIVGAGLVLIVPRRFAPPVALVAIAAAGLVAIWEVRRMLGGEASWGLGGMLRLDGTGAIVLLLVLTLGFFAALVSSQTEEWPRRFYALLLAFTTTMTLAATADNLGLLWASVEATTLSSALLVGHRRTRQSTEAAWKYLILSSTGILFAFVATIMLVLAGRGAGQTTLSASGLMAAAGGMDPGLVRLAMVLALVGYGTKAGIVPYHFWLPDAHSEAPAPVSALLSGVLLSCALLALDRFIRIGRSAGEPMQDMHLTLGAVSVVVGGALVLAAHTFKRMLAYSSVENMGLVLFALGLASPLAMMGAYLHVVAHGVAKALAFFSAGRVHHHLDTVEIAKAHNLLERTPAAGRGLLVGLLALAGVPPLAPFASKFVILGAAIALAEWPYVAALLFGLVLAFTGFVRHLATMMPHRDLESARAPSTPFSEPASVTTTLVLLAVLNLVICLAGPLAIGAFLDGVALAQAAVP